MQKSLWVDWPSDLAWVVARLEPYDNQPMFGTPTDAGPSKQRRSGSPFKCFGGSVDMNEGDWRKLKEFHQALNLNLVRIKAPDSAEDCLVTFINQPRAVVSTFLIPGQPTYTIQIDLAVNPHSERVLKEQ